MFRPSDLRCWSTEGLWCCQGGGDDDDDDTNYNGGGCGDDDYADDVDYGDDEHIIDDDYVDNGNIFYHLPGCFDKLLCVRQPLRWFGLQVILTYMITMATITTIMLMMAMMIYIALHYPLQKKSCEG